MLSFFSRTSVSLGFAAKIQFPVEASSSTCIYSVHVENEIYQTTLAIETFPRMRYGISTSRNRAAVVSEVALANFRPSRVSCHPVLSPGVTSSRRNIELGLVARN